MKCCIIIALFCLPLYMTAQELNKNEIDKFTKSHVKQTSYEKIWRDALLGGMIEVSAKNIDGTIILWFKFHERSIFSISTKEHIYLLLENDKSIKLRCISGDIATPTQTIWHGTVGYEVQQAQIEDLTSSGLVSMRIDYINSYVIKNVKSKHKDVISKSLKLVKD